MAPDTVIQYVISHIDRRSVYLSALSILTIATLFRWRLLSIADRWIAVLILATLTQEFAAAYLALYYSKNLWTFHVYTPIEVGIICMYFDRSMRFRKPYLYGGIIAAFSILLSGLNTWKLQPINTFNSYFLLYEGCLVIVFCLLSFYKLLIRDDVIPVRMAHFWLTICFLLYWSLTFANLGLFARVPPEKAFLRNIFIWTLYCANLLFYFGIITVFARYKKLIPSGD
jgi:hypothetical protein